MSSLSRPLILPNGATLPNRIAKSAMSERLATADHAPTEALVALYRRWGAGGAGLLITGNVMIDRHAQGEPGNVAVSDRRDLPRLRAWAEAAQAGGARVWMQINHPGRQSPRMLSPEPVAPSAVAVRGMAGAFATPRALTDREIREIVQAFGETAAIAQEAGFDGVQIHGAHGYLVSQFLSPRTNRRTDGWGGDPDRRRRFLLEVVREVRRRVGPGFTVALKLNSADFQRGGFTASESMEVVEALEEEGLDLLEISGGTYERAAMFDEGVAASTRAREAFFLDYARKVRQVTGLPLLLTGGFRSAAAMAGALDEGAIDVAGLARPLVVEPELPARMLRDSSVRALPLRIGVGHRKLDGLLAAAWYSVQLRRMGQGFAPDPGMWRLRAVLTYLWEQMPSLVRRPRSRSGAAPRLAGRELATRARGAADPSFSEA